MDEKKDDAALQGPLIDILRAFNMVRRTNISISVIILFLRLAANLLMLFLSKEEKDRLARAEADVDKGIRYAIESNDTSILEKAVAAHFVLVDPSVRAPSPGEAATS